MPIDRADALRKAEKFLRQGKLDSAIAEYLRVVEDQPRDWNAANTLGDLYARAGQSDKAVEQFVRIADGLNEEGFVSKAAALYKKALKLKPDDEHSLLQGAEISASQGLLADARTYLNAVRDRRKSRKDARGVAQIQIRLAALDPNDYEARRVGANARVQIDDIAGAVDDFTKMAADLTEKGRQADAVEALRQASALSPDDAAIRAQLLEAYVEAGDFVRARECATTADQFRSLALAFEAKGHEAESLAALSDAARLAPDDAELRSTLARAFVARGDLTSAAEYLTEETAGSDPELLLTVAEMYLRGDRAEQGLALVRRLLADDPSRREQVAILGWTVAEQASEAGFRTVEMAADTAVAESDWASAAAALQEFVTRVPNHIPALMRLVEICVDGGLEATMYSAQAQLADAYIAAGSANEALVISEDLVAREPWERANVERFRRALELRGEADPEGVIAARLSGQSPFMSTDLTLHGDLPDLNEHAAPEAASIAEEVIVQAPEAAPAVSSPSLAAETQLRRSASVAEDPFDLELGAESIDLDALLVDDDPSISAGEEQVDVDVSIPLDGDGARVHGSPTPTADTLAAKDGNLDGVFERLRSDAARRSATEAAQKQYAQGVELHQAGDLDGAIGALKEASRAPSLRFEAAALLGRIHRSRNMTAQAIEWFERAAEAPAPSADEAHLLLYELADVLESSGETARALAICMALQSEAGRYRDVAARVDRLSKVQARG
ncbi:MAG TPA: tetratricopeptide repeat protein [Vicinamibacterales bacterium]